MPHLVRHQLIVRGLHHKADVPALLSGTEVPKRAPLKQDLSRLRAMGRQGRLELAQQRCLSAAGLPAQHQKGAFLHAQRDMIQRGARLTGVSKAQLADLERLHARSSFQCSIAGSRQSTSSVNSRIAVRAGVLLPCSVG